VRHPIGLVVDCRDPVEPPRKEHGSTWVVMNDPEGNEFCVCDGGGGV